MPAGVLPATIGRYQILEELGRGAMGRVFRARDPNVDRHVALKVLAPLHLAGGEGEADELRRRFILEARAAGRLSHPGIVMVLDADADPATGSPYIAMELVAGRSLEDLLREQGRLPPERAAAIVAEVARALAYAHGEGVIHRDVKPANILIPDRGPVKVSDFGIAKLASQSLTVTGHVLGSPFFMSPEQVRGEPVDARTDLFSLGAVLYRAVTGTVPFDGDTIATVAFKVVNIEPRPARDHAPEIPAALEAVIDRALAKDPAERFAGGAEMAAALDAVAAELRGEAAAAAPAGPPAAGTGGDGRHGAPPDDRRGASGDDRPGAPADDRPGAGGGTVVLAAAPPRPRTPPATEAARGARSPTARRAALLGLAAAALAVAAVAAALVAFGLAAALKPGTAVEAALERLAPADAATEPAAEGAAPPVEAAAAAETVPSPEPAQLHLVYNNRLATGTMTVWVDGERAWSGPVSAPRNFIKRVAAGRCARPCRSRPGNAPSRSGSAAGRRRFASTRPTTSAAVSRRTSRAGCG